MGHACARPPDSVKSNNDQTTREQDLLEPIAVVGFSLKFPDDATSAESFWNMLIEGRCASEEFPKDRLNLDAFYDPNPDRQGTVRPHRALDSLSRFFFISRKVWRLKMK